MLHLWNVDNLDIVYFYDVTFFQSHSPTYIVLGVGGMYPLVGIGRRPYIWL
jgi:hypothetical protein